MERKYKSRYVIFLYLKAVENLSFDLILLLMVIQETY